MVSISLCDVTVTETSSYREFTHFMTVWIALKLRRLVLHSEHRLH